MRVLVTGGAGYIGSVLVRMLRERGDSVLVVDSLRCRDALTTPFADLDSVEFIRGDVRDSALMQSLCKSADAIVHLAALVGYPLCDAHPEEAVSVNRDATIALAALAGDTPLIFTSTASIYGRVATDECDESQPAAPQSIYGQTKAEAESAVLSAGGIVLRPVTAFGVAPELRWDLLVHQFMWDAVSSGHISVYEPAACRPLISVQDIAQAICLCLDKNEAAAGRVFNVSTADLVLTKRDIAARIAEMTGARVTEVNHQHDPDMRDYHVNGSRIAALGFTAATVFESALSALQSAAHRRQNA